MAKYRRLRHCAEARKVSGYVKIGKPGILVFHGSKDAIKGFLEGVRALRYLQFQHIDTRPLDVFRDSDVKNADQESQLRMEYIKDSSRLTVADSKIARMPIGLVELSTMKGLIESLENLGGNRMREWFRTEMGMSGGTKID